MRLWIILYNRFHNRRYLKHHLLFLMSPPPPLLFTWHNFHHRMLYVDS